MTKTKAALLIFFVSFIVYSNSLAGEFVWDDQYFVVKNTAIRSLKTPSAFFTNPTTAAFGGLSEDVYRPLTTLSYAVNYRFNKLNSFGYHLVNVLLHSANAILLFLLLYCIMGDILLSFFAALFFAVHPIQTEAVAWISGRSSVQFLLFYLASLLLYIKYSRAGKPVFIILSILSFVVALFSKEMAVTLPLVLILYDAHFEKKGTVRRNIAAYAPYFILSAFFIMTRAFLLQRVSQCGWWGGGAFFTFISMTKAAIDYIKILVFPAKLCAFYYIVPSRSIFDPGVMFSIAALFCLLVSIPFIFKRLKILSFAILWFFVTMLPVSNIVPLKAIMAERFLYLPSIGFCLAMVILMDRGCAALKGKIRSITVLALTLLIIGYSAKTVARNDEWARFDSISKSIIAASPSNPWGLVSVGLAEVDRGKYESAIDLFKKAIAVSQIFLLSTVVIRRDF